ncbi:DCN1-like protein 4 isoform X3 [Xenia sp. Carnegie-2017]|uniref:DCN1-like protein 4 isoform X3 n=1 Tax=Xenia sp. Carnegie-2017 TaxID=2897299 RepID=UPI001F045978|nr:DCN1-like protein 4 isoform X3 [Xenia sp. Carnegie-2017]XP_046852459.1 DCN1-like protein 4 isoform X3 [Xenia sp. Carnegie-2017]XP_046852460.1 DCN1-like protein 4 isoform X3 [Xenia sp. Carnegie-2017]
MPPRGKRKATKDTSSAKEAKLQKTSEVSHKREELSVKTFSMKKCKLWFDEYADEPDLIGPQGIQRLCKDLLLDPEDIVLFVVTWQLNAENLGFFKFSEWSKGMAVMQCDSTKKLQSKIKSLKNLITDPVMFKKMYRFTFDLCRNKDQRNLDIEMALEMLKLLLSGSWSLLDLFIEFIKQSTYKVINKDQWCNILEFSRAVKSDLSNYDVDGAWPVMLDEFVEWLRDRKKLEN